MPIKLNKCAKCGAEAIMRNNSDQWGRFVEVICRGCGMVWEMRSHYGARPALAKHWNKENPQEVPHA